MASAKRHEERTSPEFIEGLSLSKDARTQPIEEPEALVPTDSMR